jgi:hypothetical protein
MWVKRAALGTAQSLFGVSTNHSFGFTTGNALNLTFGGTSALTTTAVFRDTSAWYHIVWTQSGTSHTVYVNGTSQGTATATSSVFNTAVAHQVGASNTANYFNGYLADVHFIDGQALTPSSFTETNATTGQLVPKAYTGTYGTNGFRLNFSNNSAATAATLGADSSGNGNNWTPNNLSVTAGAGNDSLTDTPTSYGTDTGAGGEVRGNYATLSPLVVSASLNNGNLQITGTLQGYSTINVTQGKWYVEFTCITVAAVNWAYCGITWDTVTDSNNWRLIRSSNGDYYNGSAYSSYGASWTATNVIGVAVDIENSTLTFYKNGVSQGQKTGLGLTGKTVGFICLATGGGAGELAANFGQRPFAYAAPSGFKALCDTNLPTPTIAKGSSAMDVLTWTGNSASSRSFTGLGFSPDFVWIKDRSVAYNHVLFDAVRGTGGSKVLFSNRTTAEGGGAGEEGTNYGTITSFDSNGFTVAPGAVSSIWVNQSSDAYVGWAWDAGTSTVTNTAGSITSQVRANASAGFSVVTATSNGANPFTVGHGLGVTPAMYIFKNRDIADNFYTSHKSLSSNTSSFLSLNTTASEASSAAVWGSGATSTTIGLRGTSVAFNGQKIVLYCFAPVTGYSSFGSYTGNGSADGPFVYLGFRPAFLMMKRTNAAGNWVMLDKKREGYNVDNDPLYANLGNAEGTDDLADITSNGFKLRSTNADCNASGGTYIYAAFAENPFQFARAR